MQLPTKLRRRLVSKVYKNVLHWKMSKLHASFVALEEDLSSGTSVQ